MLDFDNSQVSEEDKKMFAEMDHFDALKTEQGYETVWSIETGIRPLDHAIFSNKPRLVTYKCIKEMGATFDDVTYETFTCMIVRMPTFLNPRGKHERSTQKNVI